MSDKRKKVTFVKSEPAGPDGFRKVTKVKKMSEKRAKKKEAKGQGKMFKNYSTDVVRAAVSAGDSSLNMVYGKGPHMESAKQEKYNLMHDNPVAKHASGGSWMSKHSNSAFQMGHESPAKNLGHGMDDMSPEKGAHRKYHLKQRMSKKSKD